MSVFVELEMLLIWDKSSNWVIDVQGVSEACQ